MRLTVEARDVRPDDILCGVWSHTYREMRSQRAERVLKVRTEPGGHPDHPGPFTTLWTRSYGGPSYHADTLVLVEREIP